MSRSGDQMHAAVYADFLTADQRLEELSQASSLAAAMAEGHLEDRDAGMRVMGLKSATWLSCRPALEAIAKREPPSHDIAAEVTDNIRQLFRRVLEYEGANFTKPVPYQSDIEGQLAEMAVYGLLWDGAADPSHKKRFIVPATSRQDEGRVDDGYRTGIDFMIYDDDGQVWVQVKSISHEHERRLKKRQSKKLLPYKPGTVVLRPYKLMGSVLPKYATLFIMDAVAKDDRPELSEAQARAEHAIACERDKAEETYIV